MVTFVSYCHLVWGKKVFKALNYPSQEGYASANTVCWLNYDQMNYNKLWWEDGEWAKEQPLNLGAEGSRGKIRDFFFFAFVDFA